MIKTVTIESSVSDPKAAAVYQAEKIKELFDKCYEIIKADITKQKDSKGYYYHILIKAERVGDYE